MELPDVSHPASCRINAGWIRHIQPLDMIRESERMPDMPDDLLTSMYAHARTKTSASVRLESLHNSISSRVYVRGKCSGMSGMVPRTASESMPWICRMGTA